MVQTCGAHLMLLQFIATENNQLLWTVFVQHDLYKLLAKRTRASRYQHDLL